MLSEPGLQFVELASERLGQYHRCPTDWHQRLFADLPISIDPVRVLSDVRGPPLSWLTTRASTWAARTEDRHLNFYELWDNLVPEVTTVTALLE